MLKKIRVSKVLNLSLTEWLAIQNYLYKWKVQIIMKKIVGEILKNKNIDENLKEYCKGFMEINNKYAAIRLAMNYYTYYTIASDDDGILECEVKSDMDLINETIKNLYNGEVADEDIRNLEELRNIVIERVTDLTCYVDRFHIYEYAFNRVEYRFKDADFAQISDEDITRSLMQYILAEEENMEVNRRIQLVIGQLPIRITKNKFYEMLSDGLSIYKGNPKSSLDDFLYMLRTSSTLKNTDTMKENYPYLEEAFDELKKIKFKELTEAEFKEQSIGLKKAAEYISDQMDLNMVIEELLNDLLIMLYTSADRITDNVVKACDEIIKDTNLLFMGKFSPKPLEEIEDMFVMLEGEQEELYPKLNAYDVTDKIKESYTEDIERLGLTKEYESIYKLPVLNSDSVFAEMDRVQDNTPADEEYLENAKVKLFKEYADLFADSERMINRAVMATAISELPIFFNNISELQDFIYNTLSICSDKAEKTAVIEILKDIMES